MTQTTLREYLRTTEDAISSGRIEEAMANCQNVLTYFPEALEAQRLLGEVYLAQGHLEEAQQTFEWVLTNDPENVIVYCDRALISERSSDIDTALDCYQQAYELSRGNANIRQEFNQLSARVGQQEFMFSRAGLARLYMRGDLLTQALQEWDAVLAISPERLDARLGLLETYWREGKYAKVEEIATQLLEEIPTCLKALLYLAHITSISNIQRARELVQRAESLDPDLVLAQEVFADLAASQPNDPFLDLIRKEPIVLENGMPVNHQPVKASAMTATQPQMEQNALASSYEKWEVLENWEQPTQTNPPVPETLARASRNAGVEEASALSPTGPEARPWQAQMEQQAGAAQKDLPWYQTDQLASSSAAVQSWDSLENARPAQTDWNGETQEEELPAPPAWLDSLTKGERMGEIPVEAQPAAASGFTGRAKSGEEAMPFFFPTEDENEGEMGWPEWLKSLGAETLEPEQRTPSEQLPEIEPTPIRPANEGRSWETSRDMEPEQPMPEGDPWAALPSMSANNDSWAESNNQPDWMRQMSPVEHAFSQNATPDWMQQIAGSQSQDQFQGSTPDWMQQLAGSGGQPHQEVAAAANIDAARVEQEQRYIASLEDLEKNLQSQGFTPLAPGSLASIASAQPQPAQQAEPSLSSALAQLGNFSQPTTESWWAAKTPMAGEPSTSAVPQTPGEPTNPFAALGARPAEEAPQPFATLPATPTPPAAPLMPTYRSDALLDSDLETTMKRPAITLQPLQPDADGGDRPYPNGKSRGERKPLQTSDESNLSNHERLVKGYQYQLSGAYDEAMQEYRLIIRNAPELLDDVISNMRALLKINPRFSLGYRVLGDAYMRKGEYLQAMESYNKALTMAKKVKN